LLLVELKHSVIFSAVMRISFSNPAQEQLASATNSPIILDDLPRAFMMRGWRYCMRAPAHSYQVAALTLTAVSTLKIAAFLLLLSGRIAHPYVGDNAANIYLLTADRIVATGTFNDAHSLMFSSQAPGYPLFLALNKFVFGRHYLSAIVCFQIVLDNVIALFLLFLGKRLNYLTAGFGAGMLWLVFPPEIVISTWITSETLFTALLVASITLWICSLSADNGMPLSFAAGIVLGLTTLVRGTTLLLPVCFFSIALVKDFTKNLLRCTVLILGMGLIVLPWTVRNLLVLGEPIVVQTGFGAFFLQGSRSEYFTIHGKLSAYPSLIRDAAQDSLPEPNDGKAKSHERWHLNVGLRNYRLRLYHEPWSFFPFLLHKFIRLWYGTETGVAYKQLILGFCSLLIVPAGASQIWLWRRDHFDLSLTLSLLVLYFAGISFVGLPELRYVIPVYPFLAFAAAQRSLELLAPATRSAQKVNEYANV
jgi:4-amino-4-deoxy-L-arabinose transferase-like glycosyltransferase